MTIMTGLMRLGRDAELRHTSDGTPVTTLSLAYNYGKPDQHGGSRPTTWVKASLWGKRAEALAQFLTKGSTHNFVLDDVRLETFTRQDGAQGAAIAARVLDVELGPKGQAQGTSAAPARATPQPRPAPAPAAAQPPSADVADMDDDIPF